MTSEGQQAGQPAEATSGDGFPPDPDGRRTADDFPHSYGPPPPATPNGGSPFVVPAVPPFGQPPQDRYGVPTATAPADGPPPSGSARVTQGSARVPQQPAPPPRRGSATDLFRGPAADADPRPGPAGNPDPLHGSAAGLSAEPTGAPFRGPAGDPDPFRGPVGEPDPFRGPAAAESGPQSVWGPPPATGARQQNDFDGYAPGSPTRGRLDPSDSDPQWVSGPESAPAPQWGSGPESVPGPRRDSAAGSESAPGPQWGSASGPESSPQTAPPAEPGLQSAPGPRWGSASGSESGRPQTAPPAESGSQSAPGPQWGSGFGSESSSDSAASGSLGSGRPPGISAFGAQRVRVPGATLTDLPDSANEPPHHFGDDLVQRGPGPEIVDRSGDSTALPRRVTSDDPTGFGAPNRAGDNIALPRRGGSPDSDLPVRGGNRVPYGMESTFGGFTPARSDPSATRRPFEPPAEIDPGSPPYADRPLAALPRRGDPGDQPPIGARGAVSYGSPAAPADQPSFGAQSGDEPYGRSRSDADDAQRPVRPAAHGWPEPGFAAPASGGPGPDQPRFGRSGAAQDEFGAPAPGTNGGSPYSRQPSAGPDEARPVSADSPYGRPVSGGPGDGPFGRAQSGDGVFGRPAAGDAADNQFGRPVSGSPADGPFRQPAFGNEDQAPFRQPASGDDQAPFGRPTSGGPGDGRSPSTDGIFGRPPTGSPVDGQSGRPVSGSTTDGPFGRPAADETRFGRPVSGAPEADSPFGRPPADGPGDNPYGRAASEGGSPYGRAASEPPDRAAASEDPFGRPISNAPGAGRPAAGSDNPFGRPLPGNSGDGVFGRPAAGDAAPSFGRRSAPDNDEVEASGAMSPSGFAQRVPGASFGPDAPASPFGSPSVKEPRDGSGPAPRDSGDTPAAPRGTARPVSASASVPMGSRVGPDEGEDAPPPPPAQAPQARVYWRPAQPAAEESPAAVVPFARPGTDPIDGVSQDLPPLGPKTPPPGGRATPVRASASARVAPPQPGGPDGAPYDEFANDGAARGRTAPPPQNPDNYGENTTDMAGRGSSPDRPYVPAAALPSMHARPPLVDGFPPAGSPEEIAQQQSGISPDRPRLGGVFPGPATGPGGPGQQSRATVTPPGPEETSSWPGPGGAVVPEQGRFDQFKPEAEEAPKPEAPPRVRLVPVLLAVVLGAVLLVGVPTGIVWLIARGSDKGFSASVGDCVQRNGSEAVKATCGDPNTFAVTAIVDAKDKCPDPGQPYVLNPTSDGKTQVLCLKPSS